MCSKHRDGDKTGKCSICFPDLNALIDEHCTVSRKLYDDLLALSGLSDPPNGRIGTNVIMAKLSSLRDEWKRDGNWIDKWGSCRVCGGEIPYGHTDNCDIWKMEKEIKSLKDQIAGMEWDNRGR